MPYDVVMPQLGMTMTEGSVLRWLKQPGDRIEKGEPLFEVQTDKVNMEVESTAEGVVAEILLAPEVTVPVGTVIARIGDGSEAAAPASAPPTARRLASPRARRIAAEHGVDIALVPPQCGDRIVEADVLRYIETRGVGAPAAVPVPAPAEPAPVPVAAAPAPVAAESPAVPPPVMPAPPPTPSPAAAVRRIIAERMSESAQTIPHFYLSAWADATALAQLRGDLLPVVERKSGAHLTFTDLLVKALAMALAEHPNMNVAWREGRAEPREGVHIGVAAQLGGKLLVLVLRDADKLSVAELALRRSELVARGQAGRLLPGDLEGASCTLSNLGAFGVDQFQAIINPPESAILAVGRIAPRPAVVDGELRVRTTVSLTLSVDHRAIDGVAAARFLHSIVRAVEKPYTLVMSI